MGLFHYHAFGLRIASEIELPELHQGTGPDDVLISFRRVPCRTRPGDKARRRDGRVDMTLWNIDFTVSGGRRIEIAAPEDVAIVDVRIYLLGSVMGALLYQRGYLPFHANVVRQGGWAAAFAGDSGAGKSTLAAWLDGRGHEVLSDDLCGVSLAGGGALVFEGIPRMKLWAETLRAFDRDSPGLTPVATTMDKYHVPLRNAGRVGSLDPVPLERIYLLDKAAPDAPAGIERLRGVEATHAMITNVYRWELGQAMLESPRAQFDQCLALANRAAVFRLRRNWGLDRFDEEAGAIERHLETPLD